ncbi:hypothetical protein ETEC_3923 [Escherichia coli ETEC H10407]|nr:hypothetical protein ETEC_3923 [Escherichia coli ETEC H10407]
MLMQVHYSKGIDKIKALPPGSYLGGHFCLGRKNGAD